MEENSWWDFVMATSLTFFCTPGHNDKTFVIALRHESGWAQIIKASESSLSQLLTFNSQRPDKAEPGQIFFAICFYSGLFRVAANPALQFCHFVNIDCGICVTLCKLLTFM